MCFAPLTEPTLAAFACLEPAVSYSVDFKHVTNRNRSRTVAFMVNVYGDQAYVDAI
jgi:hypothetical protein